MKYKLGELANLITEKISILELNLDNYISTESMLPNKEGKESASKLPSSKNVNMHTKGDILVSNIRPYFKKIWLATENGGHSADVLCFRVKDINLISNGFLFFSLFKDDFFDFMMLGSKGTKMPRGDKEAIMQYEINVPNILEQQEIVSVLSSIMSKMDVLKKINDNLLELVYLNYLKIIDKTKKQKLSDIAEIIMGQSPKSDTYNTNMQGLPLLNGAADFKNGQVFPNKYTTDPKKITKSGDYIFGVRATLGRTTKVFNEYALGRGTGAARVKDEVHDEFLFCCLVDMFNIFDKTATGSVYKNVSGKEFNAFEIPYLSSENSLKFHIFASPILQKYYSNFDQINTLQNMRDVLINELI